MPAHNEEDIISRTIESLFNQTYPFEFIMIIANNCTDNTINIVRKLIAKYGNSKLRLKVMEHNIGKKSGALNYGFSLLDPSIDYVFSMDADTIVDSQIVEAGVKILEDKPSVGGVCSAYKTFPLEGSHTFKEKLIWRLQNIEFALANAWRIENYKSARVLPGVSVLYRMKTLLQVKEAFGRVWDTTSLVEDYRLTLEIKDLGWEARSSSKMISNSDVPLTLKGKNGLNSQRQRWYSGTIDEIRKRGFKKNSRYEIFTIFILMFTLLSRVTLYSSYILLLIRQNSVNWVSVFLILPVLAIVTQLYRLIKYGDQLDKWQIIITVTLIFNELYAIYREILYAYSIWLSYRRPNRSW